MAKAENNAQEGDLMALLSEAAETEEVQEDTEVSEEEQLDAEDADGEVEDEAEEEGEVSDDEETSWVRNNPGRLSQFIALDSALADKATAASTMKSLVNALAQHHSMTVEDLLDIKPAKAAEEPEDDYEFDDDRKLREKLRTEILGELKPILEELKGDLSKRKEEGKLSEWLASNGPKVRNAFEKQYGIKLSQSQVAEALKANPGIEPMKALQLHHFELIRKELGKHQTRSSEKGPKMIRGTEREGRPVKNSANYGLLDAFEEVGLKGF